MVWHSDAVFQHRRSEDELGFYTLNEQARNAELPTEICTEIMDHWVWHRTKAHSREVVVEV